AAVLSSLLSVSVWGVHVDLTNSTLVSHLEQGKHLFVIYSNTKWDDETGSHKDEKAAWERLAEKYKEDPVVLIGHVHCYKSGEELKMCKEHQISGYPTIAHYKGDEWSTPGNHQQYGGKRDFVSLVGFVETYLKLPKGAKKPKAEL
ncbi:unnamed protein product, partial [Polarella glacialis]